MCQIWKFKSNYVPSTIINAANATRSGARILEDVIESQTGVHIPHNTLHMVLIEHGFASEEPKKKNRRKWIRYEREHTNSMWHTDYKQIDDGRWFISYQDDAS